MTPHGPMTQIGQKPWNEPAPMLLNSQIAVTITDTVTQLRQWWESGWCRFGDGADAGVATAGRGGGGAGRSWVIGASSP